MQVVAIAASLGTAPELTQGRQAPKCTSLPVAKARDAQQGNVECEIKYVSHNPQTGQGQQARLAGNESIREVHGSDENTIRTVHPPSSTHSSLELAKRCPELSCSPQFSPHCIL